MPAPAAAIEVSWSTTEVARLLDQPYGNGINPRRLFPHRVKTWGSGHPLRHTRRQVAGALIFAALWDRHHYPQASAGRPSWHAPTARTVADAFGDDDNPPWVVCWPDGWHIFTPPRLPSEPVVTVLFLDLILRPLIRGHHP